MFNFFRKKALNSLEYSHETNSVEVNRSTKKELYIYIEKQSGIILDENKPLIEQKIVDYCKNNNITSFSKLLEHIQESTFNFEEFITLITINETYFFREHIQIQEALENYKNTHKKLHILSLPSSTGEEVYSIVITALEMNISNFTVVGVDIDKNVIQKAKEGIYNERSLHRVKQDIIEKYFTKKNNSFYVKEDVKKFVEFHIANIFETNLTKLGKFDIIFSRNMFIYFNDEKKIQAYKHLQQLKKENTTKIYLGHADVSSQLEHYIRN
ncbi:CheR family methyltransferase [Sulfurimonas sp. NWX367]|uniref:CheR family methyltransferase n=1 Tax=Sulfurimonas sp. NWX367 TaxID=2925413 RepID=UPI00320468D2